MIFDPEVSLKQNAQRYLGAYKKKLIRWAIGLFLLLGAADWGIALALKQSWEGELLFTYAVMIILFCLEYFFKKRDIARAKFIVQDLDQAEEVRQIFLKMMTDKELEVLGEHLFQLTEKAPQALKSAWVTRQRNKAIQRLLGPELTEKHLQGELENSERPEEAFQSDGS